MSTFSFNATISFAIAIAVLFLGLAILKRVNLLAKYHIPAPIIGGIVVTLLTTACHLHGIDLVFDLPLKTTLMLMFFASVGYSANLALLRHGGKALFAFLFCATLFIVFQDVVGLALAKVLNLDPMLGLLAGSITLSGGHGTGAAWASIFAEQFHIDDALEIAMACATFGLVVGGIFGGPLGKKLIQNNELASFDETEHSKYIPKQQRHGQTKGISPAKWLTSGALLLVSSLCAQQLHQLLSSYELFKFVPNFVYAIALGVIVGNISGIQKALDKSRSELNQVGNLTLGLFLSMALMELKLWNLLDLALPLLAILMAQILFTLLFVYWVTFRVMGRSYDAAVMSAGHVGFGMGATPTAMMNLNAITSHYGPSTQAYFVVPLVGAFFIDIVNLAIIQTYIALLN